MASTGGLEAEFQDPRRKELLQALKDALSVDTIRSIAWACLWLSDINMLEDIVAEARTMPLLVESDLENIELQARLVSTCRLLVFILFDLLILLYYIGTQRKRSTSGASTPKRSFTPLQPSPEQQSPEQQSPLAQDSHGQKRNSSGQLVIARSKQQRDLVS
jgi:hypothetical protein